MNQAIDLSQLQMRRQMEQREYEIMQFDVFKLLLVEEYRLARGDQRKAGKDGKLEVNVLSPIQVANAAVGRFLHLHRNPPKPKGDEAKLGEELRKEQEQADKQADMGTAPAAPAPAETVSPGGIVLP